ncbi:hypothetical protein MASR1M8_11220 [Thermomonas brevis]
MLFPSTRLAAQLAQMAVQAPFVMAVRMGDWWMPVAAASPRQRREASRMVLEKQAAGIEAWTAFNRMAWDAWMQWLLARPLTAAQWERGGQATLAPYARRVRANAARLRRRKR